MSDKLEDLFDAAVLRLGINFARPKGIGSYGRGKDYDLLAVKADIAAGFRVCTKCGEKKAIENFSKRKAHVTGYKGWCKACDKLAFAAHREHNKALIKAKDREKYYTKKFGLDPTLSAILADPANRISNCPICRKTDRLVLDHDHRTGKIRELICAGCNSMLGFAEENIDTLYEAIAYIKKHRGV